MGGKWSVSVLLLCPYAPPFGGGNIRSVIFGFPRLWVCRWLQPQPPTIRTASILASSGTLAPLAVWLFICSVSALCGGFLAVFRCSLVVQPTKSRQRAQNSPLRHFSALGGLSLRLGRFRAVSALYRLRSVATLCASRVSASLCCRLCWCRGLEASSRWVVASRLSPYSLALSSRVSAWVVNLPLNRLIASCFFASTIFA